MKATRRIAVGLAAVALAGTGVAAQAQAWQPERNVEIVINTAPGSGQDVTGRLIQSILQERKIVTVPINVNNKPGGGGIIAYTHLQSMAGKLAAHARMWRYEVNLRKTKYMCFNEARQCNGQAASTCARDHGAGHTTPVWDGEQPIERVSEFKYLDIHLHEKLKWTTHKRYVLNKTADAAETVRRKGIYQMQPRQATYSIFGPRWCAAALSTLSMSGATPLTSGRTLSVFKWMLHATCCASTVQASMTSCVVNSAGCVCQPVATNFVCATCGDF